MLHISGLWQVPAESDGGTSGTAESVADSASVRAMSGLDQGGLPR